MTESVGLTRGVGWQLGVRRTFDCDLDTAWQHLVLGAGVLDWLGELGADDALTVGQEFVADAPGWLGTGVTLAGQVRTRQELRRIRVTWRPSTWTHESTLQLTVLPAKSGTTIAIHQERLANEAERTELLVSWGAVLARWGDQLTR
jgi:hypothetical protein